MSERGSFVDRAALDACIHCGFCLPACPTYEAAGTEMDSPRGRIDLVRALAEGRATDKRAVAEHLARCLGCRACETACPSDVPYGRILEQTRAHLSSSAAPQNSTNHASTSRLLHTFASPTRTLWLLRAVWIARRLGLLSIARRFEGSLGRAARLAPDPSWTPHSWNATTNGNGTAVTVLPGCVMDQGFATVQRDAVRLLRAAGCDVTVPRGPLCCGALHAHAGDTASADALLERVGAAVRDGTGSGSGDDPVMITTAAGCGAHLQTHAAHLGPIDVLSFLAERELSFDDSPPRTRLRVAYDDPCHLLHGQGVHHPPRVLLARVPHVDLVPLPDSDRCCGGAGAFTFEQPELADAVAAAKIAQIEKLDIDVVATANPGCHLQIAAGLRAKGSPVRVEHVVTLLAQALPKHPDGD